MSEAEPDEFGSADEDDFDGALDGIAPIESDVSDDEDDEEEDGVDG